jgi:HPt (histidine-containing phosphotransfer) domain-containing protein
MGDRERAALDAGMDAFLSKPFDVPEAIALIRRLTGHLTGPKEDRLIQNDREGSASAHVTPAGAAAIDPVARGPGSDVPVGPDDAEWPGVDLDRVLAIWPDPAVYRRYLRRFADSYAEVAATIATAEPDAVRQLAHKLKGTAGTLGLVEVAARAGELERSLKPEAAKEPGEIERQAGALADALETVLAFIGGFAPETSAPPSTGDPEGPPTVLSAQTHARVAVLLSRALAAFEQFDPVAAATILKELSVHLPPPQLEPACRAAEELDSSAGAAALTALAVVLGIELQKQC